MGRSLGRTALVALALLVGCAIVLHYTLLLMHEELREWRRIPVQFTDVGGLREGDAVTASGARVGRVGAIALFRDGQRVVLEVEPALDLRTDVDVRIVSTNALGFVGVELVPGAAPDPLPPDAELTGRVLVGVGGGSSMPERRRRVQEDLEELARSLRTMQRPDAGTAGQLLFDAERARGLRAGLRDARATWRGIDRSLARIEAGQGPGAGLTPESLDAIATTLGNLRQTLEGLRGALRGVARGEGAGGRLAGDAAIGRGAREGALDLARGLRAARRGEGTAGAWTHPRGQGGAGLDDAVAGLARATDEGVRGEGLLGVLSAPRHGDPARAALRGLSGTLEGAARSPALRDPEGARRLGTAAGELDDRIVNLGRAVLRFKRTLPARDLVGAVFSIF